MATWSDWFTESRAKGLALGEVLKIDTKGDIVRLEQSGLPHFQSIIFDGNEATSAKVKDFYKKFGNTWVRVVNKQSKERKYKIGIKSHQEFVDFLDDLSAQTNKFSIQLFENCEDRFGGNVQTRQGQTVIEIVEGKQDLIGKSTVPYFHGMIDKLGKLAFVEHDVEKDMFLAAKKVLSYLQVSRNTYIEGYFEFISAEDGKVFFLDYKLGFS